MCDWGGGPYQLYNYVDRKPFVPEKKPGKPKVRVCGHGAWKHWVWDCEVCSISHMERLGSSWYYTTQEALQHSRNRHIKPG